MVRRSLRSSGISSAHSTPRAVSERTASSSRKRAGSPSETGSARASKRGKERIQEFSYRPKPSGTNGQYRHGAHLKKSRKSDEDSPLTSTEATESSSEEGDDGSYSSYGEEDGGHQGSAVGTSESRGSSEDSASVSESEFEDDVKGRRKRGSLNKRISMGRKKMKGSSRPKTESPPAGRDKGDELWRQGVKAGLGPGTEMVIQRPKPRDAGKVPYTDATIHPNTMLFLGDLKANNDREWLKSMLSCFLLASIIQPYLRRITSSIYISPCFVSMILYSSSETGQLNAMIQNDQSLDCC